MSRQSVQYVDTSDMLRTEEGRARLREWCARTRLTGDANYWLGRIEATERHLADAPAFGALPRCGEKVDAS